MADVPLLRYENNKSTGSTCSINYFNGYGYN